MALHTELPIYKVTFNLLSLATDLTKNLPRDFKQSLGGRMRDECVEMIMLISRANASKDKAPHITGLLERLQVAEVLFRLFVDKKFISLSQFASAIELTAQIGRQAGGWRKKFPASSPVT
ncbi:four helix bundle protein [Oxalobacteraceae bacterium]|nr:four helix bundle protein [Oxalobacteraceae bacterium]